MHRYASLLAFVCLPVAALALGRAWRTDARWGRFATATCWLGAVALAWLAPILLGFVLRPLTGVPWWQFVPLGLFERGLALTEVVTVVVMGVVGGPLAGTPPDHLGLISPRPPAPWRRAGAGSPRP